MKMAAKRCAHCMQEAEVLLKFGMRASPVQPMLKSPQSFQTRLANLFLIVPSMPKSKIATRLQTRVKIAHWQPSWMLGFQTSSDAQISYVVFTLAPVGVTKFGVLASHATARRRLASSSITKAKAAGFALITVGSLVVLKSPNHVLSAHLMQSLKRTTQTQTVLKGNYVQTTVSSKV